MIIADTHALLWWVADRSRLSNRAREALDRDPIGVAAITCYEIARLVERGRFRLEQDVQLWLEDVFALPNVGFLPITIDISVAAAKLTGAVRDPIDRIIVATAALRGFPLVTKDHKIIASGAVPTIW